MKESRNRHVASTFLHCNVLFCLARVMIGIADSKLSIGSVKDLLKSSLLSHHERIDAEAVMENDVLKKELSMMRSPFLELD